MICASPRKTCSDAPGYIFENLIHKTLSRQLRHYKTMTSSWISITFLYLTAFKECEICCNVFIEISYFDTNLVKFGALIISRLEEFDPPKSQSFLVLLLICLCSSFYSKNQSNNIKKQVKVNDELQDFWFRPHFFMLFQIR